MPADILNVFNDLDLSLVHVWTLIVRGSVDRRSAFHTPCVTTVDQSYMPQSRVMVLRKVNQQMRQLQFHTDVRSTKTAQLAKQGNTSILCYDAHAKIQIRLNGVGKILMHGEEVDAAWRNTSLYGRRCYLADPGPGCPSEVPTSGLDPRFEGQKPSEADTMNGRINFAVLRVNIDELEWLFLANDGHRRAYYAWKNNEVEKFWLVP